MPSVVSGICRGSWSISPIKKGDSSICLLTTSPWIKVMRPPVKSRLTSSLSHRWRRRHEEGRQLAGSPNRRPVWFVTRLPCNPTPQSLGTHQLELRWTMRARESLSLFPNFKAKHPYSLYMGWDPRDFFFSELTNQVNSFSLGKSEERVRKGTTICIPILLSDLGVEIPFPPYKCVCILGRRGRWGCSQQWGKIKNYNT